MAHGFRMLVAAAALVLSGWTDAGAAQWVTKMPCDSVTIEGVTYPRIRFTVQNQDPFAPVEYIAADPIAQPGIDDTCRAVSVAGPPHWMAVVEPGTGLVLWARDGESAPTLLPGQVLGGFQIIVTGEHSCCYQMSFNGPFEPPIALENASFTCDMSACGNMPVPTLRRTWGALKSFYR